MEGLLETHKRSSYHRHVIGLSKICGCFHCLRTFEPIDIREWKDKGETALCPDCGVDSVLGDVGGFPLTTEFLKAMHNKWFGQLPREGV